MLPINCPESCKLIFIFLTRFASVKGAVGRGDEKPRAHGSVTARKEPRPAFGRCIHTAYQSAPFTQHTLTLLTGRQSSHSAPANNGALIAHEPPTPAAASPAPAPAPCEKKWPKTPINTMLSRNHPVHSSLRDGGTWAREVTLLPQAFTPRLVIPQPTQTGKVALAFDHCLTTYCF